jgi:hypothetical protein
MSNKARLEKLEAIVNPRPQRPSVHAIFLQEGGDMEEQLRLYKNSIPFTLRAKSIALVTSNVADLDD